MTNVELIPVQYSVARLGGFPLDLGDFWPFSEKSRERNSLVGKFSGFFYSGFF